MARDGALSRLVRGLKREPRMDRPELDVFPAVDPRRLAATLDLERLGRERGAREEPPTGSLTPDEVETRILERVEAERKAAHGRLLDELKTVSERLSNLDFEGRFAEIRHAAPAAVSEFRAEAATGRDELHGLRRRLTEHEAEKEAFKRRHRLERTPRPPSTAMQVLKIGIVALLLMVETVLNGSFLAKGSETGLLGGTTEAFAFAFLNVLGSYMFGMFGLPELSHRNWLRKLLGLLSIALYFAFAISLNLALAHYREVSGGLVTGGGAEVMQRLQDAPAAFADIKSWLFFGIGFLFSFIAFVDGFASVDPYPGFGDIEVRLDKAREAYIRRKQDLIDTLLEVRDEYIDSIQEANRDLSVRRAEHDQILDTRARLVRLFDQHQAHLQTVAANLVAVYRDANRAARSTPVPARFSEAPAIARVPIEDELPEGEDRTELRRRIADAQALLEKEVLAIHATFDEAVASYHEIDKVIPEVRHGAVPA